MDSRREAGSGWRLGYRPSQTTYPALLGAEDWAVELTAAELEDFCRLLGQLSATMASLVDRLMAEETIDCEVESDQLWMQASGYPQAYSLRLLLQQGRQVEGNWPPAAVAELLPAVQRVFPTGKARHGESYGG